MKDGSIADRDIRINNHIRMNDDTITSPAPLGPGILTRSVDVSVVLGTGVINRLCWRKSDASPWWSVARGEKGRLVVVRVGLTGGIGSGKSEVARLLAARGAVVVDADQLAREVVERGSAGLDAVVGEFGPGVLAADGSLDRAVLAALVFTDAAALRRLESIVHPLVRARADALFEAAPAGSVTRYAAPK